MNTLSLACSTNSVTILNNYYAWKLKCSHNQFLNNYSFQSFVIGTEDKNIGLTLVWNSFWPLAEKKIKGNLNLTSGIWFPAINGTY